MSILDSIITTKSGAPRITLYGKPGIGKSTLASQFPSPLFILTEDNELPGVQAIAVAKSYVEVHNTVKGLLLEPELPFKTIVIDTISKLDVLITRYILEQEPDTKNGKPIKKATTLTAACGGYGAGFMRAASIHRSFKYMMDKFKERGIAVVYLAHLVISKYKSPDAEDYDVFNIIMNHDKSREVYIDDVDLVGFCRLNSYMTETESGRNLVNSTAERVILANLDAAQVSKNRYGINKQIPMSFESLASHIPFYNLEKN